MEQQQQQQQAAEAAPPPAWALGAPMERLREAAALFAKRQRPLCFGAFGLAKEREVASALQAGGLFEHRSAFGELLACALAQRLTAAGGFTDFAGRHFRIPAGSLRVHHFAALDASAGAALLRDLHARSRSLWLEIFEEDETARAAVEACPFLRYAATRIGAGSELFGEYTAETLPAMPLHPAESAALVIIEPEFLPLSECAAILREAEEYAASSPSGWAQHYSTYNKRKSWTAFALRGFDAADPGFIIKPAEMARGWQAENPDRMAARPEWTPASEAMPRAMEALARLLDGAPCERARLMRLAPGGELSRHADTTNRDAGLADGRLARLHLPIATSPGVVMHAWGKRGEPQAVHFPRGALCYLDQRKPHRVENRAQEARVHLVVDLVSSAALRSRIAAADAAALA